MCKCHVGDFAEQTSGRELDTGEGRTAPEGVVSDGQNILRDYDLRKSAFVEAQLWNHL